MKFSACGPSLAHGLKFQAVPSETAHGTLLAKDGAVSHGGKPPAFLPRAPVFPLF